MIDKTEQEIIKNWEGDLTNPIVSICCITYNHENYIAETLDSFLMQETNFPFEIIVRDDASLDKTADIIREYEAKYSNIIKPIYEKENGYQKGIKATPVTFKKAIGEYIALCEGDDYWTDTLKLKKQVDFLTKNKEYIICYGKVEAFNEKGIINNYVGGAKKDLTQKELKRTTPINTLTVMFRNISLLKEMPYEVTIVKLGDLFMWSLLGNYGKGKYLGDIKPTRYRIHDGGIFSKKTLLEKEQMWFDTAFALYLYYRRINDNEMSRYFLEKVITTSLRIFGYKNFVFMFLKKIFKYIFKIN